MRKAQIFGQVFIYTLAAIVFGLILLFGYRAISSFMQTGEDVALIDLKHQVQTSIDSIGSTPDVQKRTFNIPSKYTKICFLGNATADEKRTTCLCRDEEGCIGMRSATNNDYNPMLCKAWIDGTRQNVFLIPQANIEISVNKIILADYYLCVPVEKGKVELRLEGKGDATLIRVW
jgi:hypothetical protein